MALDGISVLDLSRLAPGPYCSMLLGDLGADVVLVEAPPEFLRSRSVDNNDALAERRRAYNALGRNKRSIVINLREPDGRHILHQMCKDVDVVLEGFRPGVVSRLGADYQTISDINPRVVYCSISGYGQSGPYRDIVGHDINYISTGGALGLIGRPGQKPSIPQNLIADLAAGGLMAAFSITSALLSRERSGHGQYIDISMSDGVLYLLAMAASSVLSGGPVPSPGEGSLSGASPHYDIYETADGKWLSIGAGEPHFWSNLCKAVGREDFIPLQSDTARHHEIRQHLIETFSSKTRDQWFEELKAVDICVAPVYALDEALSDPHNLARQMVVELNDSRSGTVSQIGIGPKFSETPGQIRTTAPTPGEHTDHVLDSLGYDEESITKLRKRRVVE